MKGHVTASNPSPRITDSQPKVLGGYFGARLAPASSLTSSMYRDLKEQAPVEVDSILGDLIERGRKHGVSASLVQAAFVSLTIYQEARARVKAAA